jgi:hypothetical protein
MSKSSAYLVVALVALALLLLAGGGGSLVRSQSTADKPQPLAVRYSPPPGVYDETISVHMTPTDPQALVYFTTDGSVPAPENGTLYTEPLVLSPRPSQVAALRAVAVLPDDRTSRPHAATYVLGMDTAVPVLSLIVAPNDLWDVASGIFANPTLTGPAWERPADVAFYETDGSSGFSAPLGVRVHGGRSRLDEKKSLRFYFRGEYGQPFLEYPLFPESDKRLFKRLVLHNGGQDYPAVSVNATLLRNHLTGDLAREAGGFASQTRPVMVYLNSELWGIYNLRERIDDRYLAENFNIEDPDLLVGFEHDLEASYGDLSHWENLQRFVAANDLRDPDNYTYMQTQVNFDNFIDYNLFQIVTANADWPHSNQLKFRERAGGQWHWMFWDSDYAFGLMPDSYIEKDMFDRVLNQEDELQQQAALMLEKLLQNPDFRNRFLVRLADLLNTVFLPDKVEAQVMALAAGLERDINQEIVRWPGTGDWQAGVDYMREFALRRPDIVREQAVAQFGLPGTAVLTIAPPPRGQGAVRLNKDIVLDAAELPWSGTYFQGNILQLEAVPAPGYVFARWESSLPLPQDVLINWPPAGDMTVHPVFEPQEGAAPQPGDVRVREYGAAGGTSPLLGLQGDWVLLEVRRTGGVDLRGWRITDNDSVTATDEGSLILTDAPVLADLPAGTTLLLVSDSGLANGRLLSFDHPQADGLIIAAVANGLLDTATDPWFRIGQDDNLVLLAPGPTADFADDHAIDYLTIGRGEPGQAAADFGLTAPPR